MIDDAHGRGPPHWLMLPVVIGFVLLFPLLLGDGGEAVTETISETFSPIGLLFLPVILLLAIQFLSSDRAASIASAFSAIQGGGGVQRDVGGGSPVGVILILFLVLGLLYSKMSLFGGDGDE